MTEIDILRAQIIRNGVNQPWGFRLQGEPLKIIGIMTGSPAARIGLRENDELTEIDNTSTNMITYEEAINLIEDHSDSILLTIERKAHGSIPVNPSLYNEYDDKFYQTYDLSGAHQRPLQQTQRPYVDNYNQNQFKQFEVVLARTPERPKQFSTPLQSNYLMNEDDDSSIRHEPQSRTFKKLQNVMENNEPYAGAAGLPPPRSASLEQMKREKLTHHHPHQHPHHIHSSPQTPSGGGSRVKVFMPQQYNSPLAMYSANNVLETFTVQAENMLNVIEEKQNYGDEYEPLYSSDF